MTRLHRALAAEFLGTATLLAAIVGSGLMGASLSPDNDAIALLANAFATVAMLYVLISLLAPTSGAHFNPAVTLIARLRGTLDTRTALAYVLAQIAGAFAGLLLAHAMFAQPAWQPGIHVRTGAGQWLSEGVATFGLLLTILLGADARPRALPALVAAYLFAAYWFTASTSFANPAVTLARAFTQSFSGIRPEDVPAFVLAQCAGALLAHFTARALTPPAQASASDSR